MSQPSQDCSHYMMRDSSSGQQMERMKPGLMREQVTSGVRDRRPSLTLGFSTQLPLLSPEGSYCSVLYA